MNVLSLFDGISVGYLALKNLNLPITNYYASEIDSTGLIYQPFNQLTKKFS